MRVVVTGGNRGLGAAFVKCCLLRGDDVLVTHREACERGELDAALASVDAADVSSRVHYLEMDLGNAACMGSSPDVLRKRVTDATGWDAVDLLILNAGINSKCKDLSDAQRNKELGTLELSGLLHMLQVNAVAPLLLAQALLPLLAHADGARVVAISSDRASLTAKTSGGNYAYGGSKCAFNMLMRTFAHDAAPKHVVTVLYHPGWLQTDMGGAKAPQSASVAAADMLAHAATVPAEDTGSWFNTDGSKRAW